MTNLYTILSFAVFLNFSSFVSGQRLYAANILQPDPLEPPSEFIVTVDTETEKYMLTWEKTSEFQLTRYQVWKAVNTYYQLVSETIVSDHNSIIDRNSDPDNNSYKYYLVSVDTCGNFSKKSLPHKPFQLKAVKGLNDGVNLSWQPYLVGDSEYFFNSILIFRGTDPLNLIPSDTIEWNNGTHAYLDTNPPSNTGLYYRIAGVKYAPMISGNLSDMESTIETSVYSFSNLGFVLLNPVSDQLKFTDSTIEIYPNPLNTETKISWNNLQSESFRLSIFDLNGRLLKCITDLNSHEYVLSRGNLKSGYYIIELRGKKTFYGKLLII